MSDLKQRLREDHNSIWQPIMDEAAARIEELEAKLATARNDALEEAAEVGAGAATDWANDNSEKAARMGIWNTVHAAIRALKSTNQTRKEKE